jgi:rubrerythrin
MSILYDMSSKGQVDEEIAKDLDKVMAEYSMRNVPSPLDDETYGRKIAGDGDGDAASSGYRCNICGYIYKCDPLPEDFICPVCRNEAVNFTKTHIV